ncbi:MAG: exodeoxyribonuclease VII large subunit [Anaerolineales bacterium]|nr:exodeoxyribonuclease VII large subunit [Anaerolineales bacterium]
MLPLFSDDSSNEGPFTVSALTTHIRQKLERDPMLQDIWVEGEVSNLTRAPSGHIYFTLKDANAQLKAVIWKSSADRLRFVPRQGDLVLANGRIAVYEPRGEYQLVATTLEPSGVGDLHREFELLKARLDAEGLFDREQRPLPYFPRKIGVVTSPKAAAFQDVLNVLNRRFPVAEVLLSPTMVQGNDAPPLIMAALERLYQRDDIDVILLVRGGGSMEDLWCFNDEGVVRTVAASPIPLVAGVGHEIDFTLVDFAADYRAPTPSAAAELITPEVELLRQSVDVLYQEMHGAMVGVLQERRRDLMTTQRALRHLSPRHAVLSWQARLDTLQPRLLRAMQHQLESKNQQLAQHNATLQGANPLAILARGYAIVRRVGDGKQISDAQDADTGTLLDIQLHRGSLRATVKDRELGHED